MIQGEKYIDIYQEEKKSLKMRKKKKKEIYKEGWWKSIDTEEKRKGEGLMKETDINWTEEFLLGMARDTRRWW